MSSESEISKDLLERAKNPGLVFGRRVISKLSPEWGEYLLITMPEILDAAKDLLENAPTHFHFVRTMDAKEVEKIERGLPQAKAVVGMGGGMALDMAKYVGWKRGLDPILVPSIASVDACVTNTVAVRDDGKVRYVGFAVPRVVISDFELMSSAPENLNRAGIGDILSIHTGCFDWKLAAERGKADYVKDVAEKVTALVDRLEGMTDELNRVSDKALKWLIEAYNIENGLCLEVGHSRPEEGSEHFFAYNAEHVTKKSFVHGELVCLGILIMSRLQGNQPGRIETILKNTGVGYQPRELGLTKNEVLTTITTLERYVKKEGLFYSIVDEKKIDDKTARELIRGLEFGED